MPPPADNVKLITIDSVTVEKCINKHQSGGAVFEVLIAKLTRELKTVIKDAITIATALNVTTTDHREVRQLPGLSFGFWCKEKTKKIQYHDP